eukprot:jgi/Tetstr1/435158/TSEL_002615.t1
MRLASCDDQGGLVIWNPPAVVAAGGADAADGGGGTVLDWQAAAANGGAARASSSRNADLSSVSWLAVAFSPDPHYLACGGYDKEQSLSPAGVARALAVDGSWAGPELRHPAPVSCLAWSPVSAHSSALLVSGTQGGSVTLWDPSSGTQLRCWEAAPPSPISRIPLPVSHIEWGTGAGGHATNTLIVVAAGVGGSGNPPAVGSVKTYSLRSTDRSLAFDERTTTGVDGVCAVSPDCSHFARRAAGGQVVQVCDLLGNVRTALKGSGCAFRPDQSSTCFSPVGDRLINESGTVWNTETGEPAFRLRTQRGDGFSRTRTLKWSPNGELLATVSSSDDWRNVVRLWRMAAPHLGSPVERVLESAEGHGAQSTVTAIAWTELEEGARYETPLNDSDDAAENNADATPVTPAPRGNTTPGPGKFRPEGEKKKITDEVKKEILEKVKKEILEKAMALLPNGCALMELEEADDAQERLASLLLRPNGPRQQVCKDSDKQQISQVWKQMFGVDVGDGAKPVVTDEGVSQRADVRQFISQHACSWITAARCAYLLASEHSQRPGRRRQNRNSAGKDNRGSEDAQQNDHGAGEDATGNSRDPGEASPFVTPRNPSAAPSPEAVTRAQPDSGKAQQQQVFYLSLTPPAAAEPQPAPQGLSRPPRPEASPTPAARIGSGSSPPAGGSGEEPAAAGNKRAALDASHTPEQASKLARVDSSGAASGGLAGIRGIASGAAGSDSSAIQRVVPADKEEDGEASNSNAADAGGLVEEDSDVEEDIASTPATPFRRADSEYFPILSIDLPESKPLEEDVLPTGLGAPPTPGATPAANATGGTAVDVATAAPEPGARASAGDADSVDRETAPVVYPKQREVASELLAKMGGQIAQAGAEFEQLAFFIQVPNLNSLLGQTLTRVEQFLSAHRAVDPAFFPGMTAAEVVYKGATSGNWIRMFDDIKERIRVEPKTLFLFIHDEAHWSPTTGTAGYFINDELLRTSPNVYTLFVSATPYNLLTVDTQVPVENEHQWFTPNEATTYYGLQRYLEHGVAPGARGCQPGAIMKDLSLSDAARKMRLTPALEERWLTWREQAQTGEREKKSAQRTKLKMLMAVETRYAAAFLQAMGRRPADLPPGATLRLPDGSALPELPEGDLTLEMVQHLVQPDRRTGRGIMILVRVADQKCGRLLFGSMRRLRDFLGLQARVAVIIDINQTEARTDDNSFGLKETIEEPLLARLLRLQRASGLVPPDAAEPLLRQYSDLDGLPCVLILCEKGKMGDTFPRSLRYYDLRMRYVNSCTERAATEQDLGRAFRYISSPGAEAELPTILVSDQLHNWLMGKRGGRMGLLERPPSRPELMGKAPRTKPVFPDPKGAHPEADMTVYRKHWRAGPKHFDHGKRAAGDAAWLANPRRFLLAAAPQIGKTGAFLHLVYLLWCRYLPRAAVEAALRHAEEPPEAPTPADSPCMALLPSGQLLHGCGCHTLVTDLTHLQVARLAEWAMGRRWKNQSQRESQHVAAQRLAALGIDGTVLEENVDIVDELASDLKGATRREAVRKAIELFQGEGGVPQRLLDAWDNHRFPSDQPLPSSCWAIDL